MDPEVAPSPWPTVAIPSDLPTIGERIVASLLALEEGWRKGLLPACLASEDIRALVGPMLVESYEKLALEPEDGLCRGRAAWIARAAEEFRRALRPPVKTFVSERENEAGLHLVSHLGGEVSMRGNQLAAARYWGIGFEFDSPDRAAALASLVLSRAVSRLASDMACLGRVCRSRPSWRLNPDGPRPSSERRGDLFERLVANILNEDVYRARRASLFEDLYEWTDLRVMYPGLPRKRGARVQVTLIGDEEAHARKMEQCPDLKSYVVVSPFQLAVHVETFLESDPGREIEAGFWDCLGREPADRSELSAALAGIFSNAFLDPTRHPTGPMAQVPAPVRRLIRSHVEAGAFEAANYLNRETGGPPS
jgi:hypothetical protein